MTYFVHIKPAGIIFEVNADETVLEAALRQNFDFPYSCGSATCGTCMGKLLYGKIDYGTVEPYALDDDQMQAGYALFCSAKPCTDLIIDMEEVNAPYYKPAQKFDYNVDAIVSLTADIFSIALSPKKKSLPFKTGQYLFWVDGATEFAFSIANAENLEGKIVLHIKKNSQNTALEKLLQHAASDKTAILKGPYGNMVSTIKYGLPTHFIALGSVSIAPLKALLEEKIAHASAVPLKLHWQVNDLSESYLSDIFDDWQTQYPNFSWEATTAPIVFSTPIASREIFYIIGKSESVVEMAQNIIQQGASPALIFSDAFEKASIFPSPKDPALL